MRRMEDNSVNICWRSISKLRIFVHLCLGKVNAILEVRLWMIHVLDLVVLEVAKQKLKCRQDLP
jgi:hypothetical protein